MGDGQSMAMSLVKLTDQPFQIHALIVLELEPNLEDATVLQVLVNRVDLLAVLRSGQLAYGKLRKASKCANSRLSLNICEPMFIDDPFFYLPNHGHATCVASGRLGRIQLISEHRMPVQE